jgi:hypothetical protein
MFATGIRAKWSSKTSVSAIGTPAARPAPYTATLAAAANYCGGEADLPQRPARPPSPR